LGKTREVGLLVGIEDDGVRQESLRGLMAVAFQAEASAQACEATAEGGAFDRLGDGVGLAVEALARATAASGEAGDGTVAAEEDGVRAAEATAGDYARHGVNSCV
jgi:hypothetical protein